MNVDSLGMHQVHYIKILSCPIGQTAQMRLLNTETI